MKIFDTPLFKNILVVLFGILLIGFSAYNIFTQVQMEYSPLDVVDAPADLPSPAVTPNIKVTPTLLSIVPLRATERPAEVIAEDNAIVSGVSADAAPGIVPTPDGQGYVPERIVVEKIGLDAPIIPVTLKEVQFEGKTYQQWLAPNGFEAGWHNTSATLGAPGNTVLNGHHNVYGEVFGGLVKLREGDTIQLYSGERAFTYKVALVMLLPEKYKSVEDRMENARWILPTEDERITLITCWPKASNTHRVVIVALPSE